MGSEHYSTLDYQLLVMDCSECGDEQSERVEICYSNGSTERLSLCADCRAAYRDGGMVQDVSLVDE